MSDERPSRSPTSPISSFPSSLFPSLLHFSSYRYSLVLRTRDGLVLIFPISRISLSICSYSGLIGKTIVCSTKINLSIIFSSKDKSQLQDICNIRAEFMEFESNVKITGDICINFHIFYIWNPRHICSWNWL